MGDVSFLKMLFGEFKQQKQIHLENLMKRAKELYTDLQFSPEIYRKIISFKDQSKIKYALKMVRVDEKNFSNVIKEMRRKEDNKKGWR